MIIKGNTVGTTMPRTDWNQTDPSKADYLKGKDDLANLIQEAKNAASDAQGDIDSHTASKNNPHGVTAEQVGARPNTWLPTIAEIGAAPGDYGLGGKVALVDSWNNALNTGFYKSGKDSATGAWMYGYVVAYDTGIVTQVAFNHTATSINVAMRTGMSGNWQPWEWVNPPLKSGAEYRTTERIHGKAVYKRTSVFGRVEYRLDGETVWHPYISNGISISADLTTAGWYKIGTVNTRILYAAAITKLSIGGNFNSRSPYAAVVEISSGYGWSKAVTTLATGGGNGGISKIATVNSTGKGLFDIYGYYDQNINNTVQIIVDASTEAGFVSANFEAAPNFNESSANSVADVRKAGYVSMETLWTNASPTSSFTEQTVVLKNNWSNYDRICVQYDRCYGEMDAKQGAACDSAWFFGNDNGSIVATHRTAEVVSGGIKITNNQTLTTGNYVTTNDRVIPQKIYGIKGVN